MKNKKSPTECIVYNLKPFTRNQINVNEYLFFIFNCDCILQ